MFMNKKGYILEKDQRLSSRPVLCINGRESLPETEEATENMLREQKVKLEINSY